ncbi:MAG: DUF3857 and transglutaminase domain-containing protein [candidate division Zixibacteria bacterium]|nr:DUF3857 and transglutaminase domain-containing protein [candidate division Zixibacteria bacterium]
MRSTRWRRSAARFLALTCCCVCLPLLILAEPNWVKVASSRDISALAHTDAEWITLSRVETMRVGANGHASSHIQVAYKVLKSSGITSAVLVEDTYVWRKVKGVHGWHILPTGKSETFDAATLVSVAPNAAADSHDDSHMLVGAFEKVVVGSIVAFEYDVEETSDWAGTFQGCLMQRQQPVAWVQYSVELPSDWQLQFVLKSAEMVTVDSAGGKYTFTAMNLPFRPDEPYMPPWAELSRWVLINSFPSGPTSKVTHFPSWRDAAFWVDSLHFLPSEPNSEVTQFVKERFAADSTIDGKLRSIASFVQNDIRYVAIEIGKGRFVPRHSSATLRNRYGDCKDKVALMRAMLTSIGVPSRAVLAKVSMRAHTELSTPFQFDHCIVAIPDSVSPEMATIAEAHVGDWVLFDPTEPSAPFGTLPIHLYGTATLVAVDDDSCLMQIPMLQSGRSTRRYKADAALAADGSITARVQVVDHGNIAAYTAHRRKSISPADRVDSVRQRFTGTIPGVKITDYQSGEGGDSTWAAYTLSGDNYLQTSGDLKILKLDFMQTPEKPAFKKTERANPIWFGYPWEVEGEVTWRLPEGWTAELVDTLNAECRTARATLIMTASDGGFRCANFEAQDGGVMEASEYAAARAFRKEYERMTTAKTVLHVK